MRSIFFSIVMLLLLTPSVFSATPTAVFIVDTANDAADANLGDNACLTSGGKCSLRAALEQINALGTSGAPHSIIFDIPGAGPHIIDRNSSYPIISVPVTIDGTTQSGASCPTASTPGNFQIELDASAFVNGLALDDLAHGSTIRGLRISNAFWDGIFVDEVDDVTVECNVLEDNGDDGVAAVRVDGLTIGGNSSADRNLISGNGGSGVEVHGSNITIRNNYIGTRNTGALTDPNGEQGIYLSGANVLGSVNTIEDNVVSANGLNGIVVVKGTLLTTILRNKVGVDVGGSADLGNDGAGIVIVPPFEDSIDGAVLIGGAGDENIIAHNGRVGVAVVEDTDGVEEDDHVAIRNNAIFDNGGLGIDLNSFYNPLTGVVGGDGVTANDDGDSDDGANQSSNFPIIVGAEATGSVRLTMNGATNHTYEIDLYSNNTCDESGFGEGETYLGTTTIAFTGGADGGTVVYNHGSALTVGIYITAVATDVTSGALANNSTSEFSECQQIVQDVFVVDNATDVDAADASTGDGICLANAGGCTLRAAIEQANALGIFVQIEFDLPIGSNNIFLTSQLPDITTPVLLDGSTSEFVQCASGQDGVPLQIVSIVGNAGINDGLRLMAGSDGSTVRALEIYRFGDDGIQINSDHNKVVCSIIGRSTDPNGDHGITILGSGNQIGGGGAQARNNITGNLGYGVRVGAVSGSAQRNVITGNFIGRVGQSNGNGGILLADLSADTTIGGDTDGTRNVIVNNGGAGISADGTENATITGNYIGLAPDGTTVAANTESGIYLLNSSDIAIGGADEVQGNFISGNTGHGIQLDGSTLVVMNENTIGSGVDKNAAGNGGNGVLIQNGANTNQVAYNRIRNNTLDGVRVNGNGSVSNAIRFNSISNNGELGIDLGTNGVTYNDGAGDPDTGANNLQNFPVFTSATSGTDLTLEGTMTASNGDIIKLDIYHNDVCDGTHGEGKTYLGTYEMTLLSDVHAFTAVLAGVNVSSGEITATAHGPGNNTSEFSACVQLGTPTAVGLSGQATGNRVRWLVGWFMAALILTSVMHLKTAWLFNE